jgi:hypothetical protein
MQEVYVFLVILYDPRQLSPDWMVKWVTRLREALELDVLPEEAALCAACDMLISLMR